LTLQTNNKETEKMDEALILQKLDDLSNEIRTLKTGVLEELRQELMPVVKQAGPLVTECLSDLDEGHTKEDLTLLTKNLLANVEMLNSVFSYVKGAMELKDEIEPVAKLVLPRATEVMGQLDGQFDADELVALLRNTLSNLEHFNSAVTMLKAGMELKDDIEPIAKIALPRAIETFAEFGENLDMEQVKPLIRNTLNNLENFNTALGMLKAGMELKDEVEPIAKLMLPRAIELVSEVSEGYDAEQVKALIRNTMANLENFNTGLGMLKSGMGLKDEIEPIAKLMVPRAIDFFTEIGGLMKVSGTALESLKDMPCTPEQSEAMSEVIRSIDLSKSNKIGPIGAFMKLNDPKVQEALGATFSMLEVIGSMLEAYRNPGNSNNK
jgi:uncharacterized protein YjgD (DUF1641 family)